MLSTGLSRSTRRSSPRPCRRSSHDLGGFAQFPWLFSVYLLAQAVSVPVYAKLADTVGRKPIMLFGIGLFLLGSILCGFAWSMPALIAFRAVQGLGAGAVQPMSITIVGDIYTVAERAKVQGYLASVWAISSVVGPTLGGVFSQFVIWRWIFFVNIPLCLARGVDARAPLPREGRPARSTAIDYAGAALLTGRARPLLILGAARGRPGVGVGLGAEHRRSSRSASCCWSRSCSSSAGRAEPVLPLWVFSPAPAAHDQRSSSLGVGAILIGLTSYVPTFLRGRARHRAARRRVRARRPDDRLADRGVARRPALPAHRLPRDAR